MIIDTLKACAAQEARIEQLRSILKPSEVREGYPSWMKRDWMKEVEFSRSDWVDHIGRAKPSEFACCHDHKEVFISETYNFGFDDAYEVERFCQKHNLVWHVSANSWHFPGRTIRIIIHPV